MTELEIREGVKRFNWWGSIDLGHGIVTPGVRPPNAWDFYHLPARVDGMRVLDVGANDGYFSFEAERRGAIEVIAIDLWDHPDAGTCGGGLDRLQFAASAIGSSVVIPHEMSVYDLPGDFHLGFDVILFLQVLYHLQHPLLAVQKLGALCKKWMVLETVLDGEDLSRPAMVFYPNGELCNKSNWWGANIPCVEAMAKVAGFTQCKIIWEERYPAPPKHRACWLFSK